MAFTMPGIEAPPAYDAQAVADETDWAALIAGQGSTGVVDGCAVSASGATMTVAVAAGTVASAGVTVPVAAVGSLAVPAASTTDRRDVVVVSSSGVVSVVQGVPCAAAGWGRALSLLPPVKPTVPAGSVLLAEVYVPGNAAAVPAAGVVDKRVIVAPSPWVSVSLYGAKGDGVTDDTAAIQAAIDAVGAGWDVLVPYTAAGFLCGALTLPSGVRLRGAQNAKLTAAAGLATSWVSAQAAVAHVGTSVVGLILDASAVTSTAVTAVIDFPSTVTSVARVRVEANRIVNAPVHGVHMEDPGFTNEPKWIVGNTVDGAGIHATGFGLYVDYVGNVEISGNSVAVTGVDGIELGHSGPTYLGGLDAHVRCIGNNVTGGGINYPFCDGALIADNVITAGTQGIQNDGNTASGVTIANNVLTDISPAAGYGAISMCGDHFTCIGNKVTMASASTQYAIGGTGSGGLYTDSLIADNQLVLTGASQTGILVSNASTVTTRNAVHSNKIQGTGAYGIAVAANKVSVRDNIVAVTGTGVLIYGNGTIGYVVDAVDLVGNDVFQSGTGYSVTDMPTSSQWKDNKGIVPGTLTATVPTSGTAVPVSGVGAEFWNAGANYTAYAFTRVYYVTASASGTTSIKVGGGPSIAIPASACVPVTVPAGLTPTPTYTGTAPTWVIQAV